MAKLLPTIQALLRTMTQEPKVVDLSSLTPVSIQNSPPGINQQSQSRREKLGERMAGERAQAYQGRCSGGAAGKKQVWLIRRMQGQHGGRSNW